jgi:hypothetical protein
VYAHRYFADGSSRVADAWLGERLPAAILGWSLHGTRH